MKCVFIPTGCTMKCVFIPTGCTMKCVFIPTGGTMKCVSMLQKCQHFELGAIKFKAFQNFEGSAKYSAK